MNKNIVNVLGTEYEIRTNEEIGKDLLSIGRDAECDLYAKVINLMDKDQIRDGSTESKIKYWNSMLRHEIIHAFFFESGLDCYSQDEKLVDFIALQFPKLKKLFEEVGCDD